MARFVRFALVLYLLLALDLLVPAQSEDGALSLLSSTDIEKRRTAIYLLRLDCRPEIVRRAIPLARDEAAIIRASAAPLFACLRPVEAEPILSRLLADDNAFVRKEAAYAFSYFAEPTGSALLTSAFAREKDPEVKSAIAFSLGIVGDLDSIPLLQSILQSGPVSDEFLRRSAARSIGQIAQRLAAGSFDRVTPRSFLPEKCNKPDVVRAAERLPSLLAVVPTLENIANNTTESEDVRREAVFALGIIGSERAVASLRRALSSPDPILSQVAREALLRLAIAP